jgi:hypothetical protein
MRPALHSCSKYFQFLARYFMHEHWSLVFRDTVHCTRSIAYTLHLAFYCLAQKWAQYMYCEKTSETCNCSIPPALRSLPSWPHARFDFGKIKSPIVSAFLILACTYISTSWEINILYCLTEGRKNMTGYWENTTGKVHQFLNTRTGGPSLTCCLTALNVKMLTDLKKLTNRAGTIYKF